MPSDDVRCIVAKRQLDKLSAEAETLSRRYTERAEAFQPIARTLANVMTWLRDRPQGTIIEDLAAPKLNGKAPLLDQLENMRRRRRELEADLHRVRSSCYPSSYCKEKAAAEIEAMAQRGAIGVSQLIEHGGSLTFPTVSVRVSIHNTAQPAIDFCEVPDPAIFAFANKDALLTAVFREIDAESDAANSLGHSERQVRESEILGDILENNYLEAAIVWAAQEQKLPAEHRDGCHPLAILQCALSSAPALNRGGSSPEHGAINIIEGRR